VEIVEDEIRDSTSRMVEIEEDRTRDSSRMMVETDEDDEDEDEGDSTGFETRSARRRPIEAYDVRTGQPTIMRTQDRYWVPVWAAAAAATDKIDDEVEESDSELVGLGRSEASTSRAQLLETDKALRRRKRFRRRNSELS
jgi:hypothetical protein